MDYLKTRAPFWKKEAGADGGRALGRRPRQRRDRGGTLGDTGKDGRLVRLRFPCSAEVNKVSGPLHRAVARGRALLAGVSGTIACRAAENASPGALRQ